MWWNRARGPAGRVRLVVRRDSRRRARAGLSDTIIDLSARHLGTNARTIFETLEGDGLTTAAVNITCYRGGTKHIATIPGVPAVYGPKHFFFYSLYESDRTGAPLAVRSRALGSIDAYAAAVGRWLVTRDAFDLLVFYLPDYDYASHAGGPDTAHEALARSDSAIAALMDCGRRPRRVPRPVRPGRLLRPRAVEGRADRGARRRRRPRDGVEPRRHGLHRKPTRGGRAARRRAVRRDRALPRGRRGRRAPRRRRGPRPARRGARRAGARRRARCATRTRARCSSRPPPAGSSTTSAAAAISAAAATARSRPPTPRCRCSRSASARRPRRSRTIKGLITAHFAADDSPSPNSRRLATLLASARVSAFALRAVEALRQRHNWLQLGKFVAVGLSGYVINLAIYAALLGWGAHSAAAVSFVDQRGEQLLVEPALDVRPHEGQLRLPGDALLRRLVRGAARQPGVAARLPRLARLGQARRAGRGDRPRHAAQLPRQQALELPALKPRA